MNPVIALLALTTAFNGLLMNLTVDAALTIASMRWRTDSAVSTPVTHGNYLDRNWCADWSMGAFFPARD